MKFINKDLIKPSIPDVLCSYHFKTILMWLNEDYENKFFIESNFSNCLLKCLSYLASCVKNKFLPHYFIKDYNLFINRIEDKGEEIILILDRIIHDWPNSLLLIKRRELGSMLRACLVLKVPVDTVCACIRWERRKGRYFFEIETENTDIFYRFIELKRYVLDQQPTKICKLLFDLKKRTKCTSWCSNEENEKFIVLVIKDILCSFGLNLMRLGDTVTNKRALHYHRSGYGCIKKYSNDCCVDTCLETAGYFTMIGNYQCALSLLENAENQINNQLSSYFQQNYDHDLVTSQLHTFWKYIFSRNKRN